MKRIFFYTTLITLVSCHSPRVLTLQETSNVENWKISDTIANKMISRLNECGIFKRCRNNSNIMDSNNVQYQWLDSTYSKAEISHVDARYRRADQARYGELRGFRDKPEKYKVKGYKTKIIKVVLTTGSMFATTNYYDVYTIKPPPEED